MAKFAKVDFFLSDEIVCEILSRLPVKSLMRFKLVSKHWRSMITDPLFAGQYRGGDQSVLIIALNDPDFVARPKMMLNTNLGKKPKSLVSQQFSFDFFDGVLSQVVKGLVCVYNRNYAFLCNIATGEIVELPDSSRCSSRSGWANMFCGYHLGFDPWSHLFKILKLYTVFGGLRDDEGVRILTMECEILTLGVDSSWRSIDPSPGFQWQTRDPSVAFPETVQSTCIDGILYWSEPEERGESKGRLIAFDIAEEKLRFISLPNYPASASISGHRLPIFGPNLLLMGSLYCDRKGIRQGYLIHPGNSTGQQWSEPHLFDFGHSDDEAAYYGEAARSLHMFHSFEPFDLIAVLPNGKILMKKHHEVLIFPSTFYLYDQIRGEFEEVIVDAPPSFPLKRIDDWRMDYYEENVISLSSAFKKAKENTVENHGISGSNIGR